MLFEKELHLARSAAMHGGDLALGYQIRGVTPEYKSDASPVTIADRETEKLIVKEITEAFPGDAVVGEEGTAHGSNQNRRWIVDPIDGTRDFVRGNDLWSILIGLEVDGRVVAGVAYFPVKKLMYSAVQGGGAYRNDTRIHCSGITEVSQAVLCLNGFNSIQRQEYAPRALEWVSKFWAVRSFGGALDAMMIAQGQAEVWIENVCREWDLAPLKIIAEEAGAKFYDFKGGNSIYNRNGVICVPGLEGAVGQLLRWK